MASKKAVMGLVSNAMTAEAVVDELQRSGFGTNDISALFPDKQGTRDFAHEKNTKAPEGAVAGVGAGAAVGGITGALIGMGIPEIEAKQYEGKIKGGNILLSIHVEDGNEQARAKKILERHGAVDVMTVGEESVPSKAAVHTHRHA